MSTCATCRFFNAFSFKSQGKCQRFPPQVNLNRDDRAEANFPTVHADNCWCGEHRPADHKE